ncbi:hypothetical protein [Pseudoxanthomonas winnipegensis]|uniref:Transmembrane protein n=1 Tax=Pseudoxanthomonas winnipegensis TaxID=2480810 RepID=A0A4Q8M1J2_9GAMM|nr:hypothetical protein [Pseudoxanthomonas winnipegensis]TAA40129.1 hypothetical protein EA655_13300 [Pseudoxanthomonas winnipegensis]
MATVQIPSKKRRVLALVTTGVYALALLALAISGLMLWRMYCESFGCVGKGIAWFGWAISFMVTLALGYVARRAQQAAARIGVGCIRALQLTAGIALAAYWAVGQAG